MLQHGNNVDLSGANTPFPHFTATATRTNVPHGYRPVHITIRTKIAKRTSRFVIMPFAVALGQYKGTRRVCPRRWDKRGGLLGWFSPQLTLSGFKV